MRCRKVLRVMSLGLLLYGTWLLLSGHYDPLLLALGALSCAAVVGVCCRMDTIDREGHPIHLTWKALWYWVWLAWEIVKSNIDVTRRILTPSLPIDPRVTEVPATQSNELGQVIYANWITLTPGTVAMVLVPGRIVVHALTAEGAAELDTGRMARRVCRMIGDPA
jgi:multicomponent Na+:H+ antiporter subunit E